MTIYSLTEAKLNRSLQFPKNNTEFGTLDVEPKRFQLVENVAFIKNILLNKLSSLPRFFNLAYQHFGKSANS